MSLYRCGWGAHPIPCITDAEGTYIVSPDVAYSIVGSTAMIMMSVTMPISSFSDRFPAIYNDALSAAIGKTVTINRGIVDYGNDTLDGFGGALGVEGQIRSTIGRIFTASGSYGGWPWNMMSGVTIRILAFATVS